MPKAFLSHSSKDKNIVSKVFKDFGVAGSHFDEVTFDAGERSSAEIFSAISSTDVFVLFVSASSLKSPWVQTEIAVGQQKLFSGKIRKILVFILDDTSPKELPEWIRDHVYRKSASPKLIAKAIRSVLLDIAIESESESSIFIGRDSEMAALKGALAKVGSESPDVIFLSGTEGIGRRSLAKKALQETYPGIVKFPVEVVLASSQGDVDFFRELLSYGNSRPIEEIIALTSQFIESSPDQRATHNAELIEGITKERQVVFLRGHEALVKDDGDLQDWLGLLVQKLPKNPRPQLVVVARRMTPASRRGRYANTHFTGLQSLSRDKSRDLLTLWLKELDVNFPSDLIDDIVEYVVGHPKNIEVAARYAAEVGIARINTDRVDFINMIRQRANALIEKIVLTDDQQKLLALFREYEYLSADDLLTALEERDEKIYFGIGYLQDHGILEKDGNYLRLAPYLIDAVSRHEWTAPGIQIFVEAARKRFLERVATLKTNDYIEISAVDHAISVALRSGNDLNNPILVGSLLPSHMLRVAREFYDSQEFDRAAELCQRALSRSHALTREAQIEAIRLRALSLARRGRTEDFFQCLLQLDKFHERVAKRNANFLRGFKARWDGKLDEAEHFYREAYKLGGDQNFHVLRELAQILASKGEFKEAEDYARAARRIAPRNAYVIDNLLEILIGEGRDNIDYLSNDLEIKELFSLLEETAKLEGRSFFESRKAHFYDTLKDPDEALDWANRAIEVQPHFVPVYLTRARILINSAEYGKAKEDFKRISKILSDSGAAGDKRYVFELQRLRVKVSIGAGEFEEARKAIDSAVDMPKSVKTQLQRELAQTIAFSKQAVSSSLKDWANKILSH